MRVHATEAPGCKGTRSNCFFRGITAIFFVGSRRGALLLPVLLSEGFVEVCHCCVLQFLQFFPDVPRARLPIRFHKIRELISTSSEDKIGRDP